MTLTTGHLIVALEWSTAAWEQTRDDEWDRTTSATEWSRRSTLDHLVDAMVLYSAYVATRATKRVAPPRNGDPGASPLQLIEVFGSTGVTLQRVLDELPRGARAFHPSGLADTTGWIAMACTEILVHTFDASPATVDPAIVEAAELVVERALPWAPPDGDGWERLLWATGRAPLGGRAPASSDWWWQSAPLDEWDRKPRRRSAPPQW